jgi:hypothetical protein
VTLESFGSFESLEEHAYREEFRAFAQRVLSGDHDDPSAEDGLRCVETSKRSTPHSRAEQSPPSRSIPAEPTTLRLQPAERSEAVATCRAPGSSGIGATRFERSTAGNGLGWTPDDDLITGRRNR